MVNCVLQATVGSGMKLVENSFNKALTPMVETSTVRVRNMPANYKSILEPTPQPAIPQQTVTATQQQTRRNMPRNYVTVLQY